MKNLKRYIHELSHASVIFPRYWFRSHIHSINKFLRLPYLKNWTINLSPLLSLSGAPVRVVFVFFSRPLTRISASPSSGELSHRARSRTRSMRERETFHGTVYQITAHVWLQVFRSSNYLVTTVITIIALRDVGARGAKAINHRGVASCSDANQETLRSVFRFSPLERIVTNLLRTIWGGVLNFNFINVRYTFSLNLSRKLV